MSHTASCQARIRTKNDTCAWNKLNSWFPFQICPLSFSKILPVPVWSFTTEEAAKIFWSDQRQSNGQPTECILILVSHAMKCVVVPGNWYSRLESKHSFLFLMQKNDLFSPLQRNSIKCLQYYFFRFDTCEQVQTKLLCFGSMSSIRSHTVPLCIVDKIESRGLLTVNTRATSLWVCTELCLWPIWMKLQRGTGSLPHGACPH